MPLTEKVRGRATSKVSSKDRKELLRGAEILLRAAAPAYGRHSKLSENQTTFAKALVHLKGLEAIGAAVVAHAALETRESTGDAAKTTIVLAAAILREAMERLDSGADVDELCTGIAKAVVVILADVPRRSQKFLPARYRNSMVLGGGAALFHSTAALNGYMGKSASEIAGIDVIRTALKAPIELILNNSHRTMKSKGGLVLAPPTGFDARSNRWTNLAAAGILDRTRMPCTALDQASIAAGVLLLVDSIRPAKGGSAVFSDTASEEIEFCDSSDNILLSGICPGTLLTRISEHILLDRISPSSTDERPSGTVAERLAKIDQYVQNHPQKSVSDCVREIFPELQLFAGIDISLPKKAPALWTKDRQPGESPPEFIKRHYAPWLGKGLTRPHVKRLDPQLYTALSNWLRHNEFPEDLDLPTLKERNDRWVDLIQKQGQDAKFFHRMGQNIRNRD